MSICYGLDDIIDAAFDVSHIGTKSPHYRNKRSCQHASQGCPSGFDAYAVLESMLTSVEENWEASPRRRKAGPSKQNWRWEKQTFLAEHNKSKEKILEKRIVQLSEEEWVNQVPTASGLYDSGRDKKRSVDLAHSVGDRSFELIELKVGSDNPLIATAEIIQYAVLYLFARLHYPRDHLMSKPLLQAEAIGLRVLAPREFYSGFDLRWLVPAFNAALNNISKEHGITLKMDFDFLWFASSFSMPRNAAETRSMLAGVTPVPTK